MAVALCLTGLALVVELWSGVAFSTVGVTAALRRRIRSHRLPPHGRARTPAPRRCVALVLRLPLRGAPLGGGQPLWNFPWDVLDDRVSLQGNLSEYSAPVWALVAFVVVIGTMVTFSLLSGRSGTSARRGRRSSRRSSRSWRRSSRGPGSARRSAPRSSSAARSSSRGSSSPSPRADARTLWAWFNASSSPRRAATAPASSAPSRRSSARSSTTARPSTCASRSSTTSTSSATSRRAARSSSRRRPRFPQGATVVYSAHGVAPVRVRELRALEHNVIDAVCPLVTKVHVQARRYADEGYTVVLIGHEGHEEVVGTMGEAPEATVLVQTVDEVEALDSAARREARLRHADDALGRRDRRDHHDAPPPLPGDPRAAQGRHLLRDLQPAVGREGDAARDRPPPRHRLEELVELEPARGDVARSRHRLRTSSTTRRRSTRPGSRAPEPSGSRPARRPRRSSWPVSATGSVPGA